MVMYLLKV